MKKLEKGFYYHYKHEPDGEVNNYAYEVLSVAYHTEIKDSEEGTLVIYRPLYEAYVYKTGKHWDARPMKMFMEKVKDPCQDGASGKEIDRFTKITDPDVISELEKIKVEMYGQ